MSTVDEQNAVFDVLHREIVALIDAEAPSMFRGTILNAFESERGRGYLLRAVRDGLAAAEKVRSRAFAKRMQSESKL